MYACARRCRRQTTMETVYIIVFINRHAQKQCRRRARPPTTTFSDIYCYRIYYIFFFQPRLYISIVVRHNVHPRRVGRIIYCHNILAYKCATTCIVSPSSVWKRIIGRYGGRQKSESNIIILVFGIVRFSIVYIYIYTFFVYGDRKNFGSTGLVKNLNEVENRPSNGKIGWNSPTFYGNAVSHCSYGKWDLYGIGIPTWWTNTVV